MLAEDQILNNRYRITAQLGQIDAGLGYTAYDKTLSRSVMIKETFGDAAPETVPVPQTVRHQSLLCASDSFTESGRHYLVTDHADGKTLGELLEARKAAFPIRDVALWADGLLDALNLLHSQTPPIIHSDIRPQNIKLSVGGNVKLFVFGVPGNGAAEPETEAMAFDAAILSYLPIEQIWSGLDVGSRKVIRSGFDEASAEILEQPLDARSDLYSIGATVYHLLTGRVPADALTRTIDFLEGKADPLVPAARLNPVVTAELSDIVGRALQIKREDRFGSASVFRQALRSASARIANNQSSAEEPVEEELVLEIPAAAPTRPVKFASAETNQLELIRRQLREAEARRLEAERRAADAEQRLLERQTVEFRLTDVAPQEMPVAPAPANAPGAVVPGNGLQTDEVPAVTEPQGRSLAKTAGAVAVLTIVGIGGWAIWNYGTAPAPAPSVTAEALKPTVSDETVLSETPSAVPTPLAEITQPANDVVAETIDREQTDKPKAVPTAPQQAKRQSSPTPKPAERKKKAVTLDDLLKDN
jgi:serine/threonine protein kinase